MRSDLSRIAELVDDAARRATAIPQLSEAGCGLALAEAYEVQRLSVSRRLARGERQIGIKLGLTSREKMAQMGLNEVIFGRLTDAMRIEDDGQIDLKGFVHPRAEPEIAFLIKQPLTGPVTFQEAMGAVEAVAPAIEIIDSRYKSFRFNLSDVVADNASSAAFVVGPWNSPGKDISNLRMTLEFNGQEVAAGSSGAILDHPINALAAAAELLGAQGERLEPGWIVMAGAATAASPLSPGVHVRLAVQSLGRVGFSVSA